MSGIALLKSASLFLFVVLFLFFFFFFFAQGVCSLYPRSLCEQNNIAGIRIIIFWGVSQSRE